MFLKKNKEVIRTMDGRKPPKRLRVKEAKVSRSAGGTLAIFIFLAIVGVVMMLPLYLSVINAFNGTWDTP